MKRVLASFLILMAADLSAARRIGFGADVFNVLVSSERQASVAVSPIAFELDCAVFSGRAFVGFARAPRIGT